MAIKESNTRLIITMSKKQKAWLMKQSKKHKVSASKFITWILSVKAREMLELTKLKDYELEELIEICKTKWTDK